MDAQSTSAPATAAPTANDSAANSTQAKGDTANTGLPAPKQKLKIRDLELDEEAAYREIQRGRHTSKLLTEAQKRAQAAEAKEKAIAEKQGKYKQDLSALFEDLGLDDDAAATLAADYIYRKQILPQEMSPEQRRVAELEAQLAALNEEKQTAAETQAQQQREALVQQESQRLQAELVEAAKAGKIPSTQYGMRKIAAKMLELESRGLSVPLEQVAAVVREESGKEFGEIASSAEISDLREWLGDSNFKAMSKRILDYFLGQMQQPKVQAQRQAITQPKAEPKMTPEQFMKRLEGKK